MALGSELYTTANALATATYEVNATTGLVNVNLTTMESASTPTPQEGSFLMHTSSLNGRIEVDIILEDAKIYQIEYWGHNLISLAAGGKSAAWVGFEASSGDGWEAPPDFYYAITPTKYTHTLKTVGTSQKLRFYATDNYDVYVEGLSIKEVIPDTTTVEIEWIDSISAAATGNKIYRDTVPPTGEVEIADIANGVQIYQDATAETGTEYKYEVQAHDGAGDETTSEEEGTNMDYITTA